MSGGRRHAASAPPRRRAATWFLPTALVGAAVVAAAFGLARFRAIPSGSPAPAVAVDTIVLITIDTLRADRVGAYGWPGARTPAMDGLAASGVRFGRAFAPSPITLPSHASLLTGLNPPGHGARHNGVPVRPDVPAVAERLRDAGWATGAFIGAFPLDRRFGLARGFEVYRDRMPRQGDGRTVSERPGREVVDEALGWLGTQPAARIFLWVHLFEPHAPYLADPARGPAGPALPPAVRYDDEVAAADAQVARLLAGLGARRASTAVVVAGDHGEAFGEHGELTHSLFLYDTTLRVPLIIDVPGGGPAVVDLAVSLIDVAPTLLAIAGAQRPPMDGINLVPVLDGAMPVARDLYAETQAPLLDFGWSPLASLRAGSLKYIEAPSPELFDLDADPGENRNRVSDRGAEAAALASRLRALERPAADPGPDADTRRRLAALGYLGGPAGGRGSDAAARPDPKDRRALAARLARVWSGELTGPALRRELETLAAEDPGNAQVRLRLGHAWLEAGDATRAEPQFRKAIAAGLPGADPYLGLALCLRTSGRVPEAVRALEAAARVEPGNPVVEANLGALAIESGRLDAAITWLTSAVTRDEDFHEARFNLARALARAGRVAEARTQAEELLRRLPSDAPQRSEAERLFRALH